MFVFSVCCYGEQNYKDNCIISFQVKSDNGNNEWFNSTHHLPKSLKVLETRLLETFVAYITHATTPDYYREIWSDVKKSLQLQKRLTIIMQNGFCNEVNYIIFVAIDVCRSFP